MSHAENFAISKHPGLSFTEYLKVAADGVRLTDVYDRIDFRPEELALLKAIGRPATVLAVVGDHCVDVIANLPIMARIAEECSDLELRILYRPEFPDLAAAYPGPAGRSHIPTYIVRSVDGSDLGVLIERPPSIAAQMKDLAASTKAEIAAHEPEILTLIEHDDGRALMAQKLEESFLAERFERVLRFRVALRDEERGELVRWIADTVRP